MIDWLWGYGWSLSHTVIANRLRLINRSPYLQGFWWMRLFSPQYWDARNCGRILRESTFPQFPQLLMYFDFTNVVDPNSDTTRSTTSHCAVPHRDVSSSYWHRLPTSLPRKCIVSWRQSIPGTVDTCQEHQHSLPLKSLTFFIFFLSYGGKYISAFA